MLYYLLNFVFAMFLSITIALAYEKTASPGLMVLFLIISLCLYLFASAYEESEHNALVNRIKELENKNLDNKSEDE